MPVSAMFRAPAFLCSIVLSAACLPLLGQDAELKPAPSEPDKYVGADVCQSCHEDAYQSFAKSAHAATLKSAASETRGCEGCHRPGGDHVEAGGDPGKIWRYPGAKIDLINGRCTRCHETSLGEGHIKAHLSCLACAETATGTRPDRQPSLPKAHSAPRKAPRRCRRDEHSPRDSNHGRG